MVKDDARRQSAMKRSGTIEKMVAATRIGQMGPRLLTIKRAAEVLGLTVWGMKGYSVARGQDERLFGKNVVINRLNMVINVVISPRKADMMAWTAAATVTW
jgi:hypothetical protein